MTCDMLGVQSLPSDALIVILRFGESDELPGITLGLARAFLLIGSCDDCRGPDALG